MRHDGKKLEAVSPGGPHSSSCLVWDRLVPESLCDAPGMNMPGLFCSWDGENKPPVTCVHRRGGLGEEAQKVPEKEVLTAGPSAHQPGTTGLGSALDGTSEITLQTLGISG